MAVASRRHAAASGEKSH